MGANYTKLSDTISATEGSGFITINGVTRELFDISSLEANIEFSVSERRMLGHRMTQHKVTGSNGSGNVTMYFMNADFYNIFVDYLKTGTYPEISLQIKVQDPQSSVGKCEVVMRHVIFANVPVAYLDSESEDPITWDSDFTFDDIENLENFSLPVNFKN